MNRSVGRSRIRGIWITLTAFASLVPIGAIPSVSSTPTKGESLCPSTRFVEGIGEACRQPDGLYQLFAPDGAPAGVAHAPHAVRAESGTGAPSGPGLITCAPADSQSYYVQTIYARAFDDTDDYPARVETIRGLVRGASNYLRVASLVPGSFLTLRVRCTQGAVDVQKVTLPTRKSSASFSTITRDLKDKGYVSQRVKYLVYYDDAAICQCSGLANVYSDDSPSAANKNNGNAGPMFAVDFGRDDAGVMLHELSHTLGAVQKTAPHTTGAFHCTDGRDVMCFNDGGPKGSQYNTNACATYVYDCGKDDYFKRDPAPGSYLATHWNLAGTNNRYVQMMRDSTPPTVNRSDPASGVTYHGCGTRQPHPFSNDDPVFVGVSCVQGSATDAETAVVRIDLVVDGRIVDSQYSATFRFEKTGNELEISPGSHTFGVVAINAAGIQSTMVGRRVTWAG